jgi:HAD superfamily hydrolase (TIGR01509 family)
MDGTLLNSEVIWDVSLADLATEYGGVLSRATRESLVGSNVERTIRTVFAEVGAEINDDSVREGAAWLTKRTGELFSAGLPWRPGAREALTALRAAGIPMALVTSTERELTELALDTIGREFFAVTICGDEVDGRNKPHPEPYLRAAAGLGVNAIDTVAVEDSVTGSNSAVSAGCAVLVVPCDVIVPAVKGKTFRDTLVGITIGNFEDIYRSLNAA